MIRIRTFTFVLKPLRLFALRYTSSIIGFRRGCIISYPRRGLVSGPISSLSDPTSGSSEFEGSPKLVLNFLDYFNFQLHVIFTKTQTTKVVGEIKPDVIVSDSVAFWGKLTAMKHKIPYVSSTTTFAFNRHSAKYMKETPWDIAKMLFSMPRINKQIRRLQEKGYPVKGILDIVQNDNETNTIVYTSKYFQPCSESFSGRYHFIGPSIRPITELYEKTAEKTVYISMGTVNQNREFYRNCIHALGQTNWQIIISMGTNTEHFDHLPENIRIYESVDQMAVLSIADAFITHCGMNSASEALFFQVPLVLFPQTPEQGAVAERAEELGAGVRLRSISQEDIMQALQQVMLEPGYRQNAVRISESFHSCGGVSEAREFLEDIANSSIKK